jgi:MATE family multidrug resistance protein
LLPSCRQADWRKDAIFFVIVLAGVWKIRLLLVISAIIAVLLVPTFIFATPLLKLMGQSDDIAELSGEVSICFIPQHFAFVFAFPF